MVSGRYIRQMYLCSYPGSEALLGPYVSQNLGQGDGTIVLDEVACLGTETTLRDCSSSSTHDCSHAEDAGVLCRYKGNIVTFLKIQFKGMFHESKQIPTCVRISIDSFCAKKYQMKY